MSDINLTLDSAEILWFRPKYILFIIDKFAGARWLLDEMKIVK